MLIIVFTATSQDGGTALANDKDILYPGTHVYNTIRYGIITLKKCFKYFSVQLANIMPNKNLLCIIFN